MSSTSAFSTFIPRHARAAVVEQHGGPVVIRDVAVPSPAQLRPGEALVKVEYSGVCHTDLHAKLGDWPIESKIPLIGGHEGAGVIVGIGAYTPNSDLQVGDRVGIKWLADSCLTCSYCLEGREQLCAKAKLSGFTVDGTFQQYVVGYTNHLIRIPEGLRLADAAPILCAGVTVYKAIKQANLRAGQWLAIPGAGGGLGHLAIQYATIQGLRVIAIDTGPEKRKLCTSFGAEAWIDFKDYEDEGGEGKQQAQGLVKAIQCATEDDLGPHAAVVTAAHPSGYEQALQYIRPGGTVVAVGLPANAKVTTDIFTHVLKEKKLIGSYVGNRQDAIEALALANPTSTPSGTHRLPHVQCSFEVCPLNDLEKVYEDMKEGNLRGRTVLKLFDD